MITLLISGLSCQWLTQDLTPATPTDESPAEETAPPTEPPTSPDTPTSPPEAGVLNAGGPWLLIETPEGWWAANPDGTAITQLTEVDYKDAIQPGGNLIAFITPAFSIHYNVYQNMALNTLSLPDGKVTKITDLTSPETEAYAEEGPGTLNFDALRAVRDQRSFAWSPDGTRLAFTGAMDGPTADIYLYTLASGEIQRVSRDEAENYDPYWSPDGAHLLYFGTDHFGVGAGFETTGVWSARGDGTNVTRLYVPERKGLNEELVGWLDATTAVMYSWWGHRNLRLFDVVSTETVVLEEERFIAAAAISGQHGAVLFANDSGLYRLTADERTPVLLSTDPVAGIWLRNPEASHFNVRFENGSVATFGNVDSGQTDLEYQVSPINVSAGSLDVAEYGLIWAWTSTDAGQPGVWITGPGMEIGQIYSGEAFAPIWDADNNLLFFAPKDGGGYRIYRATFLGHYEDLTEVGALEASDIRSIAWIDGR
jgi:hypothetical protein